MVARDSHCRSGHFVLCRQIYMASANVTSAAQWATLFRCRVWVSGSGVRVLSAVWLVYVYVSSEFESRSQHQVCPRCVDGAAVSATLGHSSLGQLQDWGQGQRATTPGKRTTLETLVLSVSCYSQAALYQILRIRFECAGTCLSTPTTVVQI